MNEQLLKEAAIKLFNDKYRTKIMEFVDTDGGYTKFRDKAMGGGDGPRTRTRVTNTPRFRKEKKDDAALFHGDVYTDKSKLRKRKFGLFSKARQTKLKGKFGKFEPIFIIGYEIPRKSLLWEIWYDAMLGKYGIFDRFGGMVGKMKDTLEHAVDIMVDVVAKEDIEVVVPDDDDIESMSRASIRRKGYTQRDFDMDRVSFESFEKSLNFRDKVLNESIATKQFLLSRINDQIEDYHETQMNRRMVSKLWEPIIGKVFQYPSKFLPAKGPIGKIVNKVQKIFGVEQEAVFVIGFTLADKVPHEIWFVENFGENTFYVFDLESAKMIGRNLRTIRDAYRIVAKRLAVPENEISDAANKR